MKKKNKKNHIRMRFSTLLLCCLAIVLCAAPRGWAFSMYCTEDGVYYYNGGVYCDDEDGEYDVTEELINTVREELDLDGDLDMLDIGAGATVNLYTSVTYSVQAHPGSILNIHSGTVGLYVIVCQNVTYADDADDADVTVYGKNFSVSNGAIDSEGKWLPDDGSGILTVTYSGSDNPIELWFLSDDIPIKLKETDSNSKVVEIDIKPGSNTNSINLKSKGKGKGKGVVPVAVLTTEDFNASDVDPTTVEFAGAEPVRWKLCDVDDDGEVDMLFHFKTKELKDLDENSTKATLTGETLGGNAITGSDEVRIVPRKKKK